MIILQQNIKKKKFIPFINFKTGHNFFLINISVQPKMSKYWSVIKWL